MTTQQQFRTHALRSLASARIGAPQRTPYHSLGEGEMHIPSWAQHRSVYRASGRTLYVIETDRVGDAAADLAQLDRAGWDVQVDPDPSGPGARITLSRRELACAA